jgi:hypothetical protein
MWNKAAVAHFEILSPYVLQKGKRRKISARMNCQDSNTEHSEYGVDTLPTSSQGFVLIYEAGNGFHIRVQLRKLYLHRNFSV